MMKLNLLEKAISVISPATAVRRAYYRSYFGGESGYVAGSRTNQSMQLFNPQNRTSDGDTLPDIGKIRARSRDLVRNTAAGAGVIKCITRGVIGDGLRVSPNLDADTLGISQEEADKLSKKIENAFNAWANDVFCDTERQLDFFALQKLAFRSQIENGDVFALLTSQQNQDNQMQLAINMIEADLCCTPFNLSELNGLIAGVRKNNFGAPVSYFFIDAEKLIDGNLDLFSFSDFKEISAYDKGGNRQILHLLEKERVGQTRGVPILAPVMAYVKQLERYSEAELAAAVLAGNFTVFIQDEDMEDSTGAIAGQFGARGGDNLRGGDIALGPGSIVQLDKGKKIETANPARPNAQYEPFVITTLKFIAMGLQLPHEVLLKHFNSSYSASQAAMAEAHELYKEMRAPFVRSFCQPIYERFLKYAVANGILELPEFQTDFIKRRAYFACEWFAPARVIIDPLKEVKAAEARVSAGLSTQKREARLLTGLDIEGIARQRRREAAMFEGLNNNSPPAATLKTKQDVQETDGG